MKKRASIKLDFEIDKLTNSIENALTGEVFDTEVVQITTKESKQIKKTEWQFDWHEELKDKSKEIDIMIKSEPWTEKELADFRKLMKEQKAKRLKALSKKEKKHFA